MKKFITIFILFITLFLFGCQNNSKNKMEISFDKDVIRAGDEVYINVKSSRLGNFVYISSDEDIASVDEYGFLSAKKPGNVTITVYLEADEETRYKRMLSRGDDIDKIESRIAHDREAFKKENIAKVDYVIKNSSDDVLEEVCDKIYQIYTSIKK